MEHVVPVIEQTHLKKKYCFKYTCIPENSKCSGCQFYTKIIRKWHYLQVLERGRQSISANI